MISHCGWGWCKIYLGCRRWLGYDARFDDKYIFSGMYNSFAMKNANVNIKFHLINTKLNSGVSLSNWSDLEGTNIVVTDK